MIVRGIFLEKVFDFLCIEAVVLQLSEHFYVFMKAVGPQIPGDGRSFPEPRQSDGMVDGVFRHFPIGGPFAARDGERVGPGNMGMD